jgi:hypothetical protein
MKINSWGSEMKIYAARPIVGWVKRFTINSEMERSTFTPRSKMNHKKDAVAKVCYAVVELNYISQDAVLLALTHPN